MSTKSTVILTEDNEHIHHDCQDDSYVLEFLKKNIDIDINNNEELVISINPGSDLYNQIDKLFHQNIGK